MGPLVQQYLQLQMLHNGDRYSCAMEMLCSCANVRLKVVVILQSSKRPNTVPERTKHASGRTVYVRTTRNEAKQKPCAHNYSVAGNPLPPRCQSCQPSGRQFVRAHPGALHPAELRVVPGPHQAPWSHDSIPIVAVRQYFLVIDKQQCTHFGQFCVGMRSLPARPE